ncbi:MAG: metalloprotease family protein [Spirosomaceae bacterium]|jgi:hypothetical protein|nr:metalloprotease family protein [Spirosomataceae bacterium]
MTIGRIYAMIFTTITFPGVIVHEIAHRFFCDLTNTKVYQVKYFEFSNSFRVAGYVSHEEPKTLMAKILICIAPLIINTFLCLVFSCPIIITIATGTAIVIGFPHLILLWVSISVGCHAIPSPQDTNSLSEYISKHGNKVAIISYLPFKVIFFILHLLQHLYLDLVYAITILYLNYALLDAILN